MKKPEFPKPRIIREDFLPEQDPLMNYRIKKVTKPDGEVWYYPQKKFLWFWIDISGGLSVIECWAQRAIFADYHKTQKDKVEYLPADSSKTVRPKPNPPPNLV
jgi:hypothetical protein